MEAKILSNSCQGFDRCSSIASAIRWKNCNGKLLLSSEQSQVDRTIVVGLSNHDFNTEKCEKAYNKALAQFYRVNGMLFDNNKLI